MPKTGARRSAKGIAETLGEEFQPSSTRLATLSVSSPPIIIPSLTTKMVNTLGGRGYLSGGGDDYSPNLKARIMQSGS